MRSDTQRNRRQLIKAAARLFENSPTPVSLAEIAKYAEVSTATAYRHFSSAEEVLHAFRAQVGSELLDFSTAPTTRGMQRLEAVSRYWVSLVLEHGGAMAQMRSHRGYLERLRENTGYLAPQAEALTEPLRQPPRTSDSATSATKPCTCGTHCSTPATSSTSSRADAPRTRPHPAWWPHCAAPSSAGPRHRTGGTSEIDTAVRNPLTAGSGRQLACHGRTRRDRHRGTHQGHDEVLPGGQVVIRAALRRR